MKGVNDLQLRIDSKKTISCIDCRGKTFNTNIAKVQAQNFGFFPPDDIKLVDKTITSTFSRFFFVRISITHLFSNRQSKEQFRNLTIGI